MELKLGYKRLSIRTDFGLNRTFMELKLLKVKVIHTTDTVLIVPLWN